jgi:hypothetical protein
MPEPTSIDNVIPIKYLEVSCDCSRGSLCQYTNAYAKAYPFPAFVVRLQDAGTAGHTTPLAALEWVWANARWTQLVDNGGLRPILGFEEERALGDWIGRARRESGGAAMDDPNDLTHLIQITSLSTSLRVTKAQIDTSDNTKGDTSPLWVVTGLESVKRPATPGTPGTPGESPKLSRKTTSPPHTPVFDSLERDTLIPPLVVDIIPPALDCRSLLQTTDWSATSLGPREKWSPVVEMMIAVIMRSPTQDSLWLGTEFNMI